MRHFADRHFATIERWASLAGMFAMGSLWHPTYLSEMNRGLFCGGIIVAAALTKLYLSDWFKYQKLENKPRKLPTRRTSQENYRRLAAGAIPSASIVEDYPE